MQIVPDHLRLVRLVEPLDELEIDMWCREYYEAVLAGDKAGVERVRGAAETDAGLTQALIELDEGIADGAAGLI